MQGKALLLAEDPGGFNWIWSYAMEHDYPIDDIFISRELVGYVKNRFAASPKIVRKTSELVATIKSHNIQTIIFSTTEKNHPIWHEIFLEFKNDLRFVAIIDAAGNAKARLYSTRNKCFLHPDEVIVPDKSIATEYDFLHDSEIRVSDHNFFELYLKYYRPSIEVSEPKPSILFIDEGVDKLNPAWSFVDVKNRKKDIKGQYRGLWAINEVINIRDKILVEFEIDILLHPKGDIELYRALNHQIRDFIIDVNPWTLSTNYMLIIGMTSNLLGEVAMMGGTVFSLLFDEHERKSNHYISTGQVVSFTRSAELEARIIDVCDLK